MSSELIFFSIFSILVVGILIFDLTVIGRKSHIIKFKEALIWSGVWISLAIGFYIFLLYNGEQIHGISDFAILKEKIALYSPNLKIVPNNFAASLDIYRKNIALEFISGYLVEYSLSIDNVFVIMMILTSFAVDKKNYKRVLFWGIIGAIVLRFIFIFVGAALIQQFNWILYVFGIFLVYTGVKMYLNRNKKEEIDVKRHKLVKLMSRYMNVYPNFVGNKFTIKKDTKSYITPLFIVLVLIEFTDLIFAFDSIPAIFAITRDQYIVFFSNIFAIIGLRSLFFLLSELLVLFRFLKVGIAVLLTFIGVKLLAHHYLEMIGFSTLHSLYFIIFIIVLTILASILFPEKKVKEKII